MTPPSYPARQSVTTHVLRDASLWEIPLSVAGVSSPTEDSRVSN